MEKMATLKFGDQEFELPIIEGTEGERAVDIRKLRAKTGLITFDPGYGNTGSCKSTITFINGEKGILKYRGIPIQNIAEKSTFLETAYLLINEKLPSLDELNEFIFEISKHTMLHENIKNFYSGFPHSAHPMAVCAAMVGSLSTFYPEFVNPRDNYHRHAAIIRLMAKLPTIAAYSYKHTIGQPFVYPRNDLNYTSNFMHMMFSTPCEEYFVDETIAEALDLLLILHADHEQNCSTSSVRLVGSSMANIFAAVSSGINALWGPLHGGANQRVIEMLDSIVEGEGSAEVFVDKAKKHDDTTRLMGFGHRVYKNYDPRAMILKESAFKVLEKLGVHSRKLEIAVKLEEIALSDEYFIKRRLYPNVDFYSGIIYQAIGFPVNMFTVLFAMGRLPGWIAQWVEMLDDVDFKIGRPRQVFVGATDQEYPPFENR